MDDQSAKMILKQIGSRELYGYGFGIVEDIEIHKGTPREWSFLYAKPKSMRYRRNVMLRNARLCGQ